MEVSEVWSTMNNDSMNNCGLDAVFVLCSLLCSFAKVTFFVSKPVQEKQQTAAPLPLSPEIY